MENKLDYFVTELFTTAVPLNVYNQYSDEHPESSIKRVNLLLYLQQMDKVKPKIMLVGEAPGYRGSCLTRVSFTSEHLLIHNMKGSTLFAKKPAIVY